MDHPPRPRRRRGPVIDPRYLRDAAPVVAAPVVGVVGVQSAGDQKVPETTTARELRDALQRTLPGFQTTFLSASGYRQPKTVPMMRAELEKALARKRRWGMHLQSHKKQYDARRVARAFKRHAARRHATTPRFAQTRLGDSFPVIDGTQTTSRNLHEAMTRTGKELKINAPQYPVFENYVTRRQRRRTYSV